jgi:hypothetical protein
LRRQLNSNVRNSFNPEGVEIEPTGDNAIARRTALKSIFGGNSYFFFFASFFFSRTLISFLMSTMGSFLSRGKRTVALLVS